MTRKPIDPLRGWNLKAFNSRYREVMTAAGSGALVRNGALQAEANAKRSAEKKAAREKAIAKTSGAHFVKL